MIFCCYVLSSLIFVRSRSASYTDYFLLRDVYIYKLIETERHAGLTRDIERCIRCCMNIKPRVLNRNETNSDVAHCKRSTRISEDVEEPFY